MRYRLKTPYRDGTTHIALEPVDFMARLAAIGFSPPHPRARPGATLGVTRKTFFPYYPPMAYYIDPERDQFESFKGLRRDQPIMMLNLLHFRDKADYEDGREATGAEAYAAYGRESAPVFRRVGGEIIWRGKPELMLIGPKDIHWDLIFVARYPTAGAFLEMVTDPEYRIAVKHRQAAVLDSRLIRTAETADGKGFAG